MTKRETIKFIVQMRDEVRNVMRTSLFLLNNFSVRIPLRASSR